MTERKALSKRLRFEVFKRDSFKCQYCGKSAPDVVLHVDHIEPVSKGGDNDIMNLITSCQACNLGKSNIELDDDSAVVKRKKQADELQERREQMRLMIEWQMGLSEINEMAVDELGALWESLAPGYILSERGKATLRTWCNKYKFEEIVTAMKVSSAYYLEYETDDNDCTIVTDGSWNEAYNKVPGIINTKRQEKTNPHLKDVYYIRGILNNRIRYVSQRGYFAIVNNALKNGVDIDDIKQAAIDCSGWNDFEELIGELVKGQSDVGS